ncbi:MAG TPA: hypothetical protein VKT81_22595 [Bryobacteraceae bacterium]|nr:hypothetical protein [Bryobacteraceae bacterium]
MLRAATLLVLSALAVHAASLRAGVAKTDITPTTHEIMWGFESRLTPSESTLDPLYARVLVLEAGSQRLAIVAVDLGRTFGEPGLDRLRDSARKSSGITCLLVNASHTHSAPIIRDEYTDAPPAWEQRALDRIGAAIADAAGHLEPVKIGAATGSVYIGHNRLPLRPDGTFGWFERNTTMLPTAPVDPTVTVLRVDRADGSPLAVLLNYACHPVILGPDNLQYSADFPAATNRTVEQALGGRVTSFFLQGAPGDINPYHAVTPLQEDAIKKRDWTGQRLGAEAARVAKEIHTESVPDAAIDFREETLNFKLRWDREKFRAGLLKFLGPKALDQMGSPIQPINCQPRQRCFDQSSNCLLPLFLASRSRISKPTGAIAARRRWLSSWATPTATTDTFRPSQPPHAAAMERRAPAPGSNRAPASASSTGQ